MGNRQSVKIDLFNRLELLKKKEEPLEESKSNIFETIAFKEQEKLGKRSPKNDKKNEIFSSSVTKKIKSEEADIPINIPWLTKSIVVKVLDKDLANGEYYSKKGVVKRVDNKFWANLKILKSGDYIQIHQSKLTTVVPVLHFLPFD